MNDLLHPLSSSGNRIENILVDYDGFINSLSERFIRAGEIDNDDLTPFPKLIEILKLSDNDLFNLANLYTIEDINKEFFNNKYTDKDIDKLFDMNIIDFQRRTLFEYSLYNLVQEKYIESISIIKKDAFKEYEINTIAKLFGKRMDKIKLYTGDTYSLAIDKNFTTICLNSYDEMLKIINSYNKENIKEIFFILRNNLSNISISSNTEIQLCYTKEIEKLITEKEIFISRMFSKCIEENEVEKLSQFGNVG